MQPWIHVLKRETRFSNVGGEGEKQVSGITPGCLISAAVGMEVPTEEEVGSRNNVH